MKKSLRRYNNIVEEINRVERLRKLEDLFSGPTSK